MGKIYLLFVGIFVLFLGVLLARELDERARTHRAERMEAKTAAVRLEHVLAEVARAEMKMAAAMAAQAEARKEKNPATP